MSACFIYFGDRLFNKFSSVDFVLSASNTDWINTDGIVFDTLVVGSQKQKILDVYPCWHQVYFVTEGGLYYCGFGKDSVNSEPFLLCGSHHYGCPGECKISAFSATWNTALFTNCKKTCYQLSCFDMNICTIENQRIRKKVKSTAVTDSQCFLVTEDCLLYCFQDLCAPVIEQVPVVNSVSQVACGKNHTVILTTCGRVYSFGNGSRGQLGHGSTNSENVPRLIEALDGIIIKLVAAGGWHSAAISECEDLYTWGWNESGQLGRACSKTVSKDVGEAEDLCYLPKLVAFPGDIPVRSAALGSRHSAALLTDGSVWTWGWNKYGQLGNHKGLFSDTTVMLEIPKQFVCQKIHCNAWGTVITGIFQKDK